MREIKFRAWDGISMQDCGAVDGCPVDFCSGSVWYWEEPTKPIMQFTGLADKNGVEIYEKDIVYIAGLGNCIVEWCNYFAGFTFHSKGDAHSYHEVIEDIEGILGNIHENPELLEATK